METTRRSFVTGLGALLAAATVPGTANALPKSDLERLRHVLENGGIIRDMEFRFYKGETLKITSKAPVLIERCAFRWSGEQPKYGLSVETPEAVTIRYCTIDASMCRPVDVYARQPYPNHMRLGVRDGNHDALPLNTL